jgi:hypothetical protein
LPLSSEVLNVQEIHNAVAVSKSAKRKEDSRRYQQRKIIGEKEIKKKYNRCQNALKKNKIYSQFIYFGKDNQYLRRRFVALIIRIVGAILAGFIWDNIKAPNRNDGKPALFSKASQSNLEGT